MAHQGRGTFETLRLRENLQGQLDRLLTQLEDLEELRHEFEDQEYAEMRRDTLQQLKEFNDFLHTFISGDVSLIDEFGSVQLAIQAAVSQAFKTPEIIRLFAEKQPAALRNRLSILERDLKLKSVTEMQYQTESLEILTALSKLGVSLLPTESALFDQLIHSHTSMEWAPDMELSLLEQDSLLADAIQF